MLTLGVCLRSHPEPGWSLGEHWASRLNDLDLWLVFGGRGQIRLDGRPIDLQPGAAVVIRPGCAVEARQDPDDRLRVDAIHFDVLDAAGRRLPESALPPRVSTITDLGLAEAISDRLRVGYHARASDAAWQKDPVAGALLRGLLLDLEAAGSNPEKTASSGIELRHRRAVTRARVRIQEHPAQPPGIAELAAEAGYSPDHFGRVFRQFTGQSPQAAIIHARLDRARYLLRSTPMTVSQVADALNYSDVFFFSRQFKRFTGQSPSVYRKHAR